MNNRKKEKNKIKKQGQAAIELTAAFLVVFMLLIASAKIFTWFADNLAQRHHKFEETREIRPRLSMTLPASPEDVTDLDYEPEQLRLVR